MGMYGTLWRVSDGDLEELTRHPERVERFLFGGLPPLEEERRGVLGFISRFTPVKITKPVEWTPDASSGFTRARAELDLEKAWHGLHFLFTGTAWEGDEPACFLISGGDALGDEIGDSVPRVLRPLQVQRFAAFLVELSRDELARRYDPERMAALEIYREVPQADESEIRREHLLQASDSLRRFIGEAADAGDAVVILVA